MSTRPGGSPGACSKSCWTFIALESTRYFALLAAFQSPRPPELLVLDEPETSLHPRVLEPLARQLIAAA